MTIMSFPGSEFTGGRKKSASRGIDLGIKFSYDELQMEISKAHTVKEHAQAEAAYKKRVYEAALKECENALKKNPHDIDHLLQKSALLDYDNMTHESLAVLEYILQNIDPDNSMALFWKAFRLGHINVELNQDSIRHERLKCYDRLLEFNPVDTEILARRADILAEMKMYSEAKEIHDNILALEPQNWEALRGAGRALMKLKRYSEAQDYFQRSLEAFPSASYELMILGTIAALLGNYQNAIELLRRAISKSPMLVDSEFVISYVYYRAGDFPKAREHISKAKSLNFKSDSILESIRESGFELDDMFRRLVEETV